MSTDEQMRIEDEQIQADQAQFEMWCMEREDELISGFAKDNFRAFVDFINAVYMNKLRHIPVLESFASELPSRFGRYCRDKYEASHD